MLLDKMVLRQERVMGTLPSVLADFSAMVWPPPFECILEIFLY